MSFWTSQAKATGMGFHNLQGPCSLCPKPVLPKSQKKHKHKGATLIEAHSEIESACLAPSPVAPAHPKICPPRAILGIKHHGPRVWHCRPEHLLRTPKFWILERSSKVICKVTFEVSPSTDLQRPQKSLFDPWSASESRFSDHLWVISGESPKVTLLVCDFLICFEFVIARWVSGGSLDHKAATENRWRPCAGCMGQWTCDQQSCMLACSVAWRACACQREPFSPPPPWLKHRTQMLRSGQDLYFSAFLGDPCHT